MPDQIESIPNSNENALTGNPSTNTGSGGLARGEGASPESGEVVLHELGESIAVSVASVQRELARYPNTLGAYVLDEVELTIPVRMRVDQLGQLTLSVVNGDAASPGIGQLHLKVRPVLGATEPPPVISGQPLIALGTLSSEDIARLEELRIFSVDDLLRVTRNAAGRTALKKLGLNTELNDALDRAAILSLPMIPSPVAESLIRIGIESPTRFVNLDATQLAEQLSAQLNQSIDVESVKAWQIRVREYIKIPLPKIPTLTVPTKHPTITSVVFEPTSLEPENIVKVTVTVVNSTSTERATQGPEPGLTYEEGDNYLTQNSPAATGAYRIGVDFHDRTGIAYPYRWGLGKTLMPGESVVVTGFIRLHRRQKSVCWVGLILEEDTVIEDQVGMAILQVT